MLNNNINNNKIYSNSGKIIGWKEGKAICKNAIASKHMMQKPRGWAWDKSILDQAEREGCIKTIIYDKENNLIYNANLTDYWHLGVRINRGYSEQICLPIMHWTVSAPGKPSAQQLMFAI